MIDLVAVQQALLVLDQGSFRRAAQIAQVRPSVISRRVRALEDSIGVSLFQRQNQGTQPTIAGQRLLARGRLILADVESLLRTAESSGRGEEGALRFGIVASIASGFSRHLLISFITSHPDLDYVVIEGSPRDHIAAVRALRIDFTFVAGMPLSPGCEMENLWHERIMVALPESHTLASSREIAWDQLSSERFIVSRVDPGPEIQDYIVRGLAALGRHPVVKQIAVQRETLLALVGIGQGLSLVGEAEAGVNYPGVVFRPLDHEEIPFSVIWSSQNDNPAFRRFLVAARAKAAERRAAHLEARSST
jgi:DNA-binding transcriptional LysR family regulator